MQKIFLSKEFSHRQVLQAECELPICGYASAKTVLFISVFHSDINKQDLFEKNDQSLYYAETISDDKGYFEFIIPKQKADSQAVDVIIDYCRKELVSDNFDYLFNYDAISDSAIYLKNLKYGNVFVFINDWYHACPLSYLQKNSCQFDYDTSYLYDVSYVSLDISDNNLAATLQNFTELLAINNDLQYQLYNLPHFILNFIKHFRFYLNYPLAIIEIKADKEFSAEKFLSSNFSYYIKNYFQSYPISRLFWRQSEEDLNLAANSVNYKSHILKIISSLEHCFKFADSFYPKKNIIAYAINNLRLRLINPYSYIADSVWRDIDDTFDNITYLNCYHIFPKRLINMQDYDYSPLAYTDDLASFLCFEALASLYKNYYYLSSMELSGFEFQGDRVKISLCKNSYPCTSKDFIKFKADTSLFLGFMLASYERKLRPAFVRIDQNNLILWHPEIDNITSFAYALNQDANVSKFISEYGMPLKSFVYGKYNEINPVQSWQTAKIKAVSASNLFTPGPKAVIKERYLFNFKYDESFFQNKNSDLSLKCKYLSLKARDKYLPLFSLNNNMHFPNNVNFQPFNYLDIYLYNLDNFVKELLIIPGDLSLKYQISSYTDFEIKHIFPDKKIQLISFHINDEWKASGNFTLFVKNLYQQSEQWHKNKLISVKNGQDVLVAWKKYAQQIRASQSYFSKGETLDEYSELQFVFFDLTYRNVY